MKLDGANLSPLLTGEPSSFKRRQPLTWHSTTSQPAVAVRDGKYSLVGWRNTEYPKDQDAIRTVMDEMRVILEKQHGRKLTPDELWHECYNSPLKTPAWHQLHSKFVLLNTFLEAWIPRIKAGSGGISRFELNDLSTDPSQSRNIAERFPEVTNRLQQTVLAINAEVLEEAPPWGPDKPPEKELRIHRLQSTKRSPFDAFVYVNRILEEPESGETQEDLAGRILGRLANQEGRILVKLPPGMNEMAYQGFKIALGSDSRRDLRSSCFACHHLPDLGQATLKPQISSLRNRSISNGQLRKLLRNDTHSDIEIDDDDAENLDRFGHENSKSTHENDTSLCHPDSDTVALPLGIWRRVFRQLAPMARPTSKRGISNR